MSMNVASNAATSPIEQAKFGFTRERVLAAAKDQLRSVKETAK
jgi:hypothetical protein